MNGERMIGYRKMECLVERCPRCKDGGHGGITFKPFRTGALRTDKYSSDRWTHWAPCPTTGEPILIRIEIEVEYFPTITEPEPTEAP